MISISKLSDLAPNSGKALIENFPTKIGRQQLDQFLALSGDANPIHAPGISSQTVIPANLLISLIPAVLQSHIEFASQIQCFTVGYRNIKFKRQIGLNDELFLSITMGKIRLKANAAYVDYEFRFDTKASRTAAAQGIMSDYCIQSPL